ncbi:MAG: AmmeMemoRadiSam system radical SAM enzyme [Bacteroidetes bacterium]|jgi:pyruvate formate lyase activating enzyme|nr:AmmeMemoRadiSam system radical SAM enzyme [Bacteroidota bacterium]MBT6687876.1 AmmeMemoRadiSam system radical SAM enzyme [Bacteroidota bacterium]MBT7142476.1 AmmeMemoRadiSam system radical SAM enzyme [Bacteroidota bacterium]MBT7490017.1 AmmeMemoRadiSam system radical SAM enzyme [Bacteroidota bacterium]
MKEALYYRKIDSQTVECNLCAHNCKIAEGNHGICESRKNNEGKLYSENYGRICSIAIDPIEKKPLYHFHSGKSILSFGSVGCNMKCEFCQNWEISQSNVEKFSYLRDYQPKQIIDKALKSKNNIGIAYTYNEPTIWYEFLLYTAKIAKKEGLKNIMVTNGFINERPLKEICNYVDAFNVDLKSFENSFYQKISKASLQPVLNTLKTIKSHSKHLEITNLIVTSINDDAKTFEEMVKWIAYELGTKTVLHISRYFPRFQMTIEQTPVKKILELFNIAKKHLKYVYLGNVLLSEGNDTICDKCGKMVIIRRDYLIRTIGITGNGSCYYCGNNIISTE